MFGLAELVRQEVQFPQTNAGVWETKKKNPTKQFTGNSKCYTGKRSSAHNPLETSPLICQCINMHLVCLSFYALKIALYLIKNLYALYQMNDI